MSVDEFLKRPAPHRFDEAILHIGAEKTGTTSIQVTLHRNRDRLAAQGFLHSLALGQVRHIDLPVFCEADDTMDDLRRGLLDGDIKALPRFRERLIKRFDDEIAQSEVRTLIVSNEHLQSRLVTDEEKENLLKFARRCADKVRVIVYLRRQDEMAVSLHSTRFKSGEWGFDEMFPEGTSYYYQFDELLKGYVRVFGRDAVTVRIFEPDSLVDGDAVADFLALCGVAKTEGWITVGRGNESLRPEAQYFFSIMNKINARFVDGRPARSRVDYGNLYALYAGKGYRPSRARAEEFYYRYHEGNQWVCREFFPERQSLFSLDFSKYPEENDPLPDIEKVMEVAYDWAKYHFAQSRWAQAQLSVQKKDYPKALEALRDVQNCQPQGADAFVLSARILAQLGNLDQAIAHARRAKEIEPERKDVIALMGQLEESLKSDGTDAT